MGAKDDGKWHGTVSHVIAAPIEKIWPILADFSGLHKHFPKIFQKCEIVEGEENKVGALRYLEAAKSEDFTIKCKERLVSLDDQNYKTTYAMEWSNTGWTSYFGHIAAKSVEKNQTQVDWSFELDPISNTTKEEYIPEQSLLFHAILKDVMEKVTQW